MEEYHCMQSFAIAWFLIQERKVVRTIMRRKGWRAPGRGNESQSSCHTPTLKIPRKPTFRYIYILSIYHQMACNTLRVLHDCKFTHQYQKHTYHSTIHNLCSVHQKYTVSFQLRPLLQMIWLMGLHPLSQSWLVSENLRKIQCNIDLFFPLLMAWLHYKCYSTYKKPAIALLRNLLWYIAQ